MRARFQHTPTSEARCGACTPIFRAFYYRDCIACSGAGRRAFGAAREWAMGVWVSCGVHQFLGVGFLVGSSGPSVNPRHWAARGHQDLLNFIIFIIHGGNSDSDGDGDKCRVSAP